MHLKTNKFYALIRKFFRFLFHRSQKAEDGDTRKGADVLPLNLSAKHLGKIKELRFVHKEKELIFVLMTFHGNLNRGWIETLKFKLVDPETDHGIYYEISGIKLVEKGKYLLVLKATTDFNISLGEPLEMVIIPPETTVLCEHFELN